MEKIDLKYIEELFERVEYDTLYAYKKVEENGEFELKRNLGEFLDLVVSYADENDIPETTRQCKTGLDDRFCYWIRFKNKVIEIGMYYDDVVYAMSGSNATTPEDIIDCEDVIKYRDNKNKKAKEEKPKVIQKS